MALTAKKVYAILKRQISDMEAKLNSPVRYRGTVATADLLPLNPDIGDMYNIESKSVYGEAGMNVAWNGVVWDTMGAPIDMSLYLTKEEAETVIQRLVTEYFEKNPVKPGATTEQAQQIEQNKTDIASLKTETGSLKEDISTKITKFYASSQGETHLADSDNGKIMDMMLYGKSEQKQYSGKNLLNVTLQTTTMNGVTFTTVFKNKMLQYINIDGTATNLAYVLVDINLKANTKYILSGWYEGANNTFSGALRNINLTSQYAACLNTPTVFTVPDDGTYRLMIRVENNATISDKKIYPMIRLASVDDDAYEPYVGGQPSPSPDYPQEIKSVVNPTVKVCGKNLLKGKSEIKNKNVTFDVDKVIVDGEISSLYGDVFGRVFLKAGTYTVSTTFNSIQRIELRYGSQSAWVIDGKASTITLSEDIDVEVTVIIKIGIYSNVTDYIQIEKGSTATAYEPYHEQTVTLPYTLNAIPVNSGGNVTIDGQQYVSDYVDVERGKLVRMVDDVEAKNYIWKLYSNANNMVRRFGMNDVNRFNMPDNINVISPYFKQIAYTGKHDLSVWFQSYYLVVTDTNAKWENSEALIQWFSENNVHFYLPLKTPTETDLPKEEITAFKALATYYPVTNIFINSEQLDGYTVFNYPVSMENGWNYVKQQIGDTRDYIYDMDARAQDTDLQAAEAYVNSEYAVALTELEV
jgi:hypothetical protein